MDVAEAVTSNVMLPDKRYASTWDSIITSPETKERLLYWAILSLRLRETLAFETTALHGLVVLHGPPGTGKTTLARGLAQQLAPLTSQGQARLVKVSPLGLMSAEHGQSQRKVTELLTEHIPALADDELPTVVLLDEVESMAVARSEASLSANPAVRTWRRSCEDGSTPARPQYCKNKQGKRSPQSKRGACSSATGCQGHDT